MTTTLTGTITMPTYSPPRIESLAPAQYRLAKKPDGTLILQGAFFWQEGFSKSGYEWRDLPTVELGAEA